MKPFVIRFAVVLEPMEYTIKLKLETKNRLKALGQKDQTYDEIVNDLLDKREYGVNQ